MNLNKKKLYEIIFEADTRKGKAFDLTIILLILLSVRLVLLDISPATGFGQFLASIVMIMGYAIIAVPTGIVTSEMMRMPAGNNTQVCPNCMFSRHDDDARFCKKCGTPLDVETPPSVHEKYL